MPLVQISLMEGKADEYIQAIADGVHQALIDAIQIPENDRFQLIQEFQSSHFIIDKTYLAKRSENTVIIHITLRQGRTQDMKDRLYKEIVNNLHQHPGCREEDVMIVLNENSLSDWSFAYGLSQR